MQKIIFLTTSPFSLRDYDKLGVQYFQERGYMTEVWDLRLFSNPERFYEVEKPKYDAIKQFKSFSELKRELKMLNRNDLVFDVIAANEWFRYFALKILNRNNIRVIKHSQTGKFPVHIQSGFKGQLKRWKSIFYFSKIDFIKKIIIKMLSKLAPIKRDFYLVSGEAGNYLKGQLLSDLNIDTHTYDFELFLRSEKKPSKKDIIFLDENPFQSIDNASDFLDYENHIFSYYDKLDRFLTQIEQDIGKEVVVAVHPRSDSKYWETRFKSRTVKAGQTHELVRNSELCITTASNAIDFIVLFKKLAVFINSSEYSKTASYPWMKFYSQELDIEIIDIEEYFDIGAYITENSFSSPLYESYIKKYIKSRYSKDDAMYKIVEDHLIQLGVLKPANPSE